MAGMAHEHDAASWVETAGPDVRQQPDAPIYSLQIELPDSVWVLF
jgi:hypothetical protein